MRADLHPRQDARLARLHAYDILDSERERDFDEVVELASRICGTPISVINLIDNDRQWFKAEVGIGARELPLEHSICAHAILEDDFVEIPDTAQDHRMEGNALVHAAGGLRFYAGAQLVTDDGLPIGTLCVLDTQPRKLDALQRQTLAVLARQVMRQIELRRRLREEAGLRAALEKRGQELSAVLRQREVLTAEIDHRVKNSLQMVASMLIIERRLQKDKPAAASLDAAVQRVMSIAALHEALYRTSAYDRVDLPGYLARIVELMRPTVPERIAVTLDTEPGELKPERASVLAVIVSEFVTNAAKHAFPGERAGTVSIVGRVIGEALYRLELADDGIGAASTPAETGGAGTYIVEAAVSQLEAERSQTRDEAGTRMRLDFPVLSREAQADTDAAVDHPVAQA